MTSGEYIKSLWAELTGLQKTVVLGAVTLVLVLMISGWVDSWWTLRKVKAAERRAEAAEIEMNDAVARANQLAERSREVEAEKKVLEIQRDEKQKEADRARQDVNSARNELERVVRQRRLVTPSTDELCAELESIGHPCQ